MPTRLIAVILFTLFSAFMAKGQFLLNYKPGMIITHSDDTLWGLVKDRGTIRNTKACFFKRDKKAAPQKFMPGDIKAYMINGERYYYSGEIFSKNVYQQRFLEVLVKGNVNLYHTWNNKDRNFYIQKGDEEPIELTNKKIIITSIPDEALAIYYERHSIDHPIYKDTLTSVFGDNQKIKNQIFNVNYNKKSLTNMTKGYIRETCGIHCIEFERDFSLEKIQTGIFSGIMFNRLTFLTTKANKSFPTKELDVISEVFTTHPIGLFLDFPFPLLKKNISLRTEINASKTEYHQEFNNVSFFNNINIKNTQLGLAWSLRYELFQKKLISPSIAFGKNTSFIISSDIMTDAVAPPREHGDFTYTTNEFVHITTQKGGWFWEVGFDFNLSPKYSLFSNFRMYSLNSLIVENFNNGVSYNTILADFAYPLEYKTSVSSVLIGLKF